MCPLVHATSSESYTQNDQTGIQMENISPAQLKERLATGADFLLLDVREPWEFEAFNIGGRLLPLNDLLPRIHELEAWKDKEVVVCCRSGNRSSMACMLLEAQGFSKVQNLEGGLEAWKAMEDLDA